MPDIRTSNGKLIYQLTSATMLKDTDLFAISTSDHLTRNISLKQIKLSINNDFYSKDDINNILDKLRLQIKNLSDQVVILENDITEFRNEFNTKLNNVESNLNQTINNLDNQTLFVEWRESLVECLLVMSESFDSSYFAL